MQVREVLGLKQKIGDEDREELEAIFQGMDTDDSRGVTLDEFTRFMVFQFRDRLDRMAEAHQHFLSVIQQRRMSVSMEWLFDVLRILCIYM